MTLTPADLQRRISEDPDADAMVRLWLRDRELLTPRDRGAPPRISGSHLAAVLGIDGRTWRRIVAWHESELPPKLRPGRPMRAAEWRLLVEVSGVDVGGQVEAA
jgi:hypothetical protein